MVSASLTRLNSHSLERVQTTSKISRHAPSAASLASPTSPTGPTPGPATALAAAAAAAAVPARIALAPLSMASRPGRRSIETNGPPLPAAPAASAASRWRANSDLRRQSLRGSRSVSSSLANPLVRFFRRSATGSASRTASVADPQIDPLDAVSARSHARSEAMQHPVEKPPSLLELTSFPETPTPPPPPLPLTHLLSLPTATSTLSLSSLPLSLLLTRKSLRLISLSLSRTPTQSLPITLNLTHVPEDASHSVVSILQALVAHNPALMTTFPFDCINLSHSNMTPAAALELASLLRAGMMTRRLTSIQLDWNPALRKDPVALKKLFLSIIALDRVEEVSMTSLQLTSEATAALVSEILHSRNYSHSLRRIDLRGNDVRLGTRLAIEEYLENNGRVKIFVEGIGYTEAQKEWGRATLKEFQQCADRAMQGLISNQVGAVWQELDGMGRVLEEAWVTDDGYKESPSPLAVCALKFLRKAMTIVKDRATARMDSRGVLLKPVGGMRFGLIELLRSFVVSETSRNCYVDDVIGEEGWVSHSMAELIQQRNSSMLSIAVGKIVEQCLDPERYIMWQSLLTSSMSRSRVSIPVFIEFVSRELLDHKNNLIPHRDGFGSAALPVVATLTSRTVLSGKCDQRVERLLEMQRIWQLMKEDGRVDYLLALSEEGEGGVLCGPKPKRYGSAPNSMEGVNADPDRIGAILEQANTKNREKTESRLGARSKSPSVSMRSKVVIGKAISEPALNDLLQQQQIMATSGDVVRSRPADPTNQPPAALAMAEKKHDEEEDRVLDTMLQDFAREMSRAENSAPTF